MSDWDDRAAAAVARREKMLSFGPYAAGLLVKTKRGLFAVDPEDNSVTSYLLQSGEYHENEVAKALEYVRPDKDVLVVGAHIGAHVVVLARSCRELVAIEANPRTFQLLDVNLKINDSANVSAFNVAAGVDGEDIVFLLNTENSGGSKRAPLEQRDYYYYDSPQEIRIRTAALDMLCAGREFSFILMDIEGSEYFALSGMQAVLSKSGCLAIEFLPFAIREVAGVQIEQFSALILPHFRQMFVPASGETFQGSDIAVQLRRMFDAGECHDLLYFSK